MKIPAHCRRRGFTLVELLVVIMIIAVLAAAGFAAGNAAIQKAKRANALSAAVAVETAVNNFFTEYGTMPRENLSQDTRTDTVSDLAMLRELLGMGNPPVNTRAIKFLSVQEAKKGKGGLVYGQGGNNVTGLFDPWGGRFHVMLDGDFDERIQVTVGAGNQRTLNGRRVAVWSDGADGVNGGGTAADDVTTW